MRLSDLSTHTIRENPTDEESINAQLLARGGFVRKLMAGAYSFLPLGLRVLYKIERIIREEMNAIGSQEILMPALHPADNWLQTGRWDKVDVLFKLKGAGDKDYALGPTHEEVVTPLMGGFINSYRDLPISVYQIQTKFRNEARAKSGLLRGREFRMKDMYSFHTSEDDLGAYYELSKTAYEKVYARCGLADITYMTYASGGIFCKYSHEYQMITPYGEDIIHVCDKCRIAINKEIMDDLNHACPECGSKDLREVKAIEVGNIFKLMTRFSDSFGLKFNDETGAVNDKIYMGCYGIGPSRLVGSIVEASHDDAGIIWPEPVAPFAVGLINLKTGDATTDTIAARVYDTLQQNKVEVLYDDRDERAGVKFADMDLIGLPWQVIVGPKGAANGMIEIKNRKSGERQELSVESALTLLKEKTKTTLFWSLN